MTATPREVLQDCHALTVPAQVVLRFDARIVF